MNNKNELSDVGFYIDGKPIGEASAMSIIGNVEGDVGIGTSYKLFHSNENYEMTLEGAYANYDKLIELFLKPHASCNIIAESQNYPRGNKLPKKKRIRNKWIKKYHKRIEFDNVTFD